MASKEENAGKIKVSDDRKQNPSTSKSSEYDHNLTKANNRPSYATRASGCPVGNLIDSMTAGRHGPVTFNDVYLIEKLQHFDREKIPARNVHALGTGAFGELTITNDISKYCKAKIFSKVGTKVPFASRLSGTFTEQGDPETTRDIRGFAMKFYTDEGNWDLMTINVPVFGVRDMKNGPDAVHAFKRDSRNSFYNASQTWDYIACHPEGLFNSLYFFSTFGGNPSSFRTQHWFACNTYSMINSENVRVWVKFHLISLQGVDGLDVDSAKKIAAEEPNFLSRDLRCNIESGNFPKWRLAIQVMDEASGYKLPFAFDCTKVWKLEDFPLIEVGELTLNRNPTDYFSEVEQIAFSPARNIPGISFSPDRLLQGRLFVYDDTQNHRLGPNFQQIYINRPHGIEPNTQYTGGSHREEIRDKWPHYFPTLLKSQQKHCENKERMQEPEMKCDGGAGYYDIDGKGSDEDYYGQGRWWLKNVMTEGRNERKELEKNLGASLAGVEEEEIWKEMLMHYGKMDEGFGKRVAEEREKALKDPRVGEKKVKEEMKRLEGMKAADIGTASESSVKLFELMRNIV